MPAKEVSPPTDAPGPIPGASAILRRRAGASLAYTVFIGMGALSVWCFGLGLVFMWMGSAWLLAQTARHAGAARRSDGSVAGLFTVVLASLLAVAGVATPVLMQAGGAGSGASLVAGVLAVALAGAALSPLAYVPIASATGTRGFIAPIVRGIDMAGAERLHVHALLCALIGVCLLLPIPLVASGIGATVDVLPRGLAPVGGAALILWMLAVPTSAAVLTTRYLRLERANEAPTRLRRAVVPLLAAYAIGLAVIFAGVLAAAVTPSVVQPAWAVAPPAGRGVPLGEGLGWAFQPIAGTALSMRVSDDDLYVQAGGGGRLPLGVHGADCVAYPRPDRGAVVECARAIGPPVRVLVTADRVIAEADLAGRLAVRVDSVVVGALALALLTLALALWWLGRIGVSLRLLARSPFSYDGTVEGDGAGALLFFDGERRVRVPRARIEAAPGSASADRGVLLAATAIAPMSYRESAAACPRDALLVVGSRDDALARRIVRARRIAFRLGVVGLVSLVAAGAGILASL